MGWSAFRPEGPTIAITPLTTSTTAVQAPAYSGEPSCVNYLISNSTTQGCFLAVGANPTNTVATIATGATSTTNGTGIWIPPSSQASYTFGANTYFAAICSTGTTTLYITPGDGM